MSEKVFERVSKVVCEKLGAAESEVVPEASFMEDLEADSLDIMELIMELEEEFGVDIPDADATSLKTVGDVVKYVEAKSSEQA